ncbi:MAG: ATP-binding protein [Victivallaceae bacterium]|nr:ATP-binding protein [Victivallaceae bacterium]
MILREHYLEQIRPFYDSDLIKVITGIRRCGKSVIMQQVRDEIQKKTNDIVYLEFERREVRTKLPDADSVLEYVDRHRKSGRCYVFLDEPQELDGWEEVCQSLRLRGNSVFITGSNSKILSMEYAKSLSGRFVSFRIRPFVYGELLAYAQELGKEITPLDYLIWGGFPKRLEFSGESLRRYLEDLNETIIYKDLIVRFKIRKEALFRAVVDFVLRSNARVVSSNSIFKAVKQTQKCSENTIQKYIGYLEMAYAVDFIEQYSTRTKQLLSFYRKSYDGDVSLNSIRCIDNRYDLDHNLENTVYNELLYMGYQLSVYKTEQGEIDFIARKGGRNYYVQVAYSVADDKAYQREFKAFEKADPLSRKILITTDDLDYSTSVVRHIRFRDFLAMRDLEQTDS